MDAGAGRGQTRTPEPAASPADSPSHHAHASYPESSLEAEPLGWVPPVGEALEAPAGEVEWVGADDGSAADSRGDGDEDAKDSVKRKFVSDSDTAAVRAFRGARVRKPSAA